MIPKYRTQLELYNDSSKPVTVTAVHDVVATWLGQREPLDPASLGEAGPNRLSEVSRIDVRHEIIGDCEEWALRYERDDERQQLTWVVDLGVVAGERTTVSISMGLEVSGHRTLNIGRRLRAPAVVRLLVEGFRAYFGRQLRTTATPVVARDVRGFVDWVGSPRRALPVVCVSADSDTLMPLLDPSDLQQHLLGLAEVVSIDVAASYALTDELKRLLGGREDAKRWTVHSGAVRVYWPNLDVTSEEASPYAHRLWLPDEHGFSREMPDQIFDHTSWAAVHRSYNNWTDVGTIQRRADLERLDQLATKLDDTERSAYESARANIAQELEELKIQLQEANAQLATAQQNAEYAYQCQRAADGKAAQLAEELKRRRAREESDFVVQLFKPNLVDDVCESANERHDVRAALDRLAYQTFWSGGSPLLEKLEDGLFEYRVDTDNHWYRFFVTRFSKLRTVAVLHGYPKKDNRLKQSEIETARRRLGEVTGLG